MPEPLDHFRLLRTRTHEAQIAAQDVPELREFVDVQAAHQPSGLQAAVVIFHRPAGTGGMPGIELHAADFDDREEAEEMAFENLEGLEKELIGDMMSDVEGTSEVIKKFMPNLKFDWDEDE